MNIIKFLLEVAFREGGSAIFWILVFGVIGFISGLVLTGFFWQKMKKASAKPDDLGVKRGSLVFCALLGLCVVPLCTFNGGLYGAIFFAEKTIKDGEFIEDALVASLGQELDMESFLEIVSEHQEGVAELKEDEAGQKLISIELLRNYIKISDDAILTIAQEYIIGKEDGSQMPGWLRWALEEVVHRLVDHQTEDFIQKAQKTVDLTEERANASYVSGDQLSWSIAHVVVKPEVVGIVKRVRYSTLVMILVQLVGILLIFGLLVKSKSSP